MSERKNTAEDIVAAIANYNRNDSPKYYNLPIIRDLESGAGSKVFLPELGTDLVFVDAKWGEEGGGENLWIVFSIDGELWKMRGYYSSWDDDTWHTHTVYPVVAREITKIIYTAEVPNEENGND